MGRYNFEALKGAKRLHSLGSDYRHLLFARTTGTATREGALLCEALLARQGPPVPCIRAEGLRLAINGARAPSHPLDFSLPNAPPVTAHTNECSDKCQLPLSPPSHASRRKFANRKTRRPSPGIKHSTTTHSSDKASALPK